jgi:hypothetical protein
MISLKLDMAMLCSTTTSQLTFQFRGQVTEVDVLIKALEASPLHVQVNHTLFDKLRHHVCTHAVGKSTNHLE